VTRQKPWRLLGIAWPVAAKKPVPKSSAPTAKAPARHPLSDPYKAAADLYLEIDPTGHIQQVESNLQDAPGLGHEWLGRSWLDTVTSESRVKVNEMLAEVSQAQKPTRWRHINHLLKDQSEFPVLYSIAQKPGSDHLVAMGRDLRSMASVQARLLQAQQLLEQDYLRMRSIENQYRTLFDLVHDPILMVEGRHGRILESNKAAQAFFGQTGAQLLDKKIETLVGASSLGSLNQVLREVDGSGRASQTSLKFSQQKQKSQVHVAHLRLENETAFLFRIDLASNVNGQRADNHLLQETLSLMTDGLVITDRRGIILHANPAFAQIIHSPHHGQVLGEPISRWLGRANTDFQVLINGLQQGGAVRLFSTQLVSDAGGAIPAEISAISLPQDKDTLFAFTIRDTGRRLDQPSNQAAGLARSHEDLSNLVGRMPLKEIVGETIDLIEKLCIEAALKLTKNNRASAADMLGLSRQSLYVKMRRFGLDRGDLQ
jgi:transcriptional regulator PpsR